MSTDRIEVISNEKPEPVAVDTKVSEAKATESVENSSAQDAKATEQNESSEDSETTETEAKRDGSESETESETGEDPAEPKVEDTAKEPGPKKKSGFQRRVDKLNARVSEKEREVEFWKQEALKKDATAPKTEPKTDPRTPAAADGRPDPNTFNDYGQYIEAVADWKAEQKLQSRDQMAAKSRQEIEQQSAMKAHSDRIRAFTEKHDDFEETLTSLDDVPNSATIQNIIFNAENGPELLYELAKNPQEAKRIAMLPPIAAAREMGRFEAKLLSNQAPAPKDTATKTTKAPKPLEPVGTGKGTKVKSLDDPNLSQEDFERLFREQYKKGKRA